MTFKMYNCDFGIKLNNVDYIFPNVDSLVIEDPEFNRITRGANGQDKIGLNYREGTKEPKTVTVTVLGMSADLKSVLDECYKKASRIDAVYAIDRTDGSGKMAKQAILCQQPQQLTLDDSPESMNVALMFQSYDLTETHKS